jgi:hypothetical protein
MEDYKYQSMTFSFGIHTSVPEENAGFHRKAADR